MGRYNMKRDFATIVVGLLVLGAGIIIGGVLLGFFDFDISLAGWWTIFIIAPALFSMAQSGVNAGNMIMLAVGVILLMNAQEIFPVYISWRLIFPIVLIAVGVQLLFGKSITCKSCGTGTDGKEQGTGDANGISTPHFSPVRMLTMEMRCSPVRPTPLPSAPLPRTCGM